MRSKERRERTSCQLAKDALGDEVVRLLLALFEFGQTTFFQHFGIQSSFTFSDSVAMASALRKRVSSRREST
jgi:hypothetical protein